MNGSLRVRKSSEGVLVRGLNSDGVITNGACSTEEYYSISNRRQYTTIPTATYF